MIVDIMTIHDFVDYMLECTNSFSLDGLKALFEYLEDLSDDIGEPIELDPIAIRCEYSEYESVKEYNKEMIKEIESWEECEEAVCFVGDEGAIVRCD